MYMASTEHFTDTRPLRPSSNPLPFMTKIVNRPKKKATKRKAARCPVRCPVGEEHRQRGTDAGCNKFLRINEQAGAVEVKRTENRSRRKL